MTHSFTKTLRKVSKEETAKNAQLLIRAGYIHKEMAGVYAYLPLGLKVLENIKNIIREELNAIGGQELLMTSLQSPEPWQKSGRWHSEKMDIWFKTELSAGGQLGLAPTHEEPLTNLMKTYISSYKDLPIYAYQFQTKFRNELRAKSGILRTREFLMKDLYSFSPDRESHDKFYHQVESAYAKIYERLGLGADTYEVFASGGIFSKYSHEYQTFTPIGEDLVWYNSNKSLLLNDEVFNDEVLSELGAKREDFQSAPAAEVGNIFTLGEKYSDPIELVYTDKDGKRKTVFMGSYGIGVSRVMGVIVEKYADEKGLIWPENLSPYPFHLIAIGEQGTALAEQLHAKFPALFLYDDRDLRPGEKFADADLIGIPHRIVISDKTLAKDSVESTLRQANTTNTTKLLTIKELESKLIAMAK